MTAILARRRIFLCFLLASAAPACALFRPDWCPRTVEQELRATLWSQQFRGDGSAEGVAVDDVGNVALIGSYRGTVDLHDGARAVIDVDGLSDMFVAKLDAQGRTLWTRHFGGRRMQLGHDVAFDRDGNVIAVGEMSGAIDFGTGELRANSPPLRSAAVVLTLDSSGRTLWAKLFDAAARAESVAIDASGNAYVTMVVREGLSVVKLDSAGNLVFDVRLDNPYQLHAHNARIVMDAHGQHGHVVVVWNHINATYDVLRGQKRDELDEPERLPSIAKLDEEGHVNWRNNLGEGISRGVAIDSRGDIMVVGDARPGQPPAGYASKFAADGRALWTRALPPRMSPHGIAADTNGNMLITGKSSNGFDICGRQGPEQTAFLARFHTAGRFVWAQQVELGSWGGGEDVAVNPAGAIVVAGFGATGPSWQTDSVNELHMFVTRVGP